MTEEKHPAYGMAVFSRQTGGELRLFGSQLGRHNDYITLSIHEAYREHSHGEDRCSATSFKPIIEIALAPSQFSTLLTTMNVGFGTPCTIQVREGKSVEPISQDELTEMDRNTQSFQATLDEAFASVPVKVGRIRELLKGSGTLKKTDRAEILGLVEGMFKLFSPGNADFLLGQFHEVADRVVTEAKAQVDEFVSATLARAGMASLKNMASAQLTSKKEE